MSEFPFYRPLGSKPPEGEVELPSITLQRHISPEGYIADKGLASAVNTALLLGEPLLLTGHPGTGKTQLAYNLAWQLGLNSPLRFQAKSTSRAQDLFYTYDSLGRFHRTINDDGNSLNYIRYQALGLAIILANQPETVSSVLPTNSHHTGQARSVVLIDEIDKAPRDFPNDVLRELETMQFDIPELGGKVVEASDAFRPIVVITSNSDRQLPDAFLRRCIYYHIQFPESEQLRMIVRSRLGVEFSAIEPFLSDALELFEKLHHQETPLAKPPSTAELISWLTALQRMAKDGFHPLSKRERVFAVTNSLLLKNREDQMLAKPIIENWFKWSR